MSPTRPNVSVLLSVHNGATFLRGSLESVLAQDDENIELVAVDDGSTDASPRILAQVAARDPRVRVLTRPHAGLTASLNAALAVAQGEFIARLDADDRALPGRFASQRRYLLEHPEISLIGGNALLIDELGRSVGQTCLGYLDHESCVNRLETTAAFIPHSSWMVRSNVMRTLGGYDEFFKKAQDYEFMLRLSEGHRLACLPQFLVELRKTRTSVSFDDDFLQYRYAVVALIIHRCRTGALHLARMDKATLLSAVGEWFEDCRLRRKMLAQRALSFARMAFLAGSHVGAIREVGRAFRLDPLFLINRRRLAELRADPIPSLLPYLA